MTHCMLLCLDSVAFGETRFRRGAAVGHRGANSPPDEENSRDIRSDIRDFPFLRKSEGVRGVIAAFSGRLVSRGRGSVDFRAAAVRPMSACPCWAKGFEGPTRVVLVSCVQFVSRGRKPLPPAGRKGAASEVVRRSIGARAPDITERVVPRRHQSSDAPEFRDRFLVRAAT